MTPLSKICPRCQRVAPLAAAVCRNCAHAFSSQFAEPTEKTKMYTPLVLPPTHLQHHTMTQKPTSPIIVILSVIGGLCVAFWVTVLLIAFIGASSIGNAEKNRPGHIVRLGEAETLTPLCSEHQVLETLGAPAQNVNDIWTYPAEGGNVVGVKFGDNGGVRGVQAICITDSGGNVIWQKI